jgi:hypothetical protein
MARGGELTSVQRLEAVWRIAHHGAHAALPSLSEELGRLSAVSEPNPPPDTVR